MSGSLGSKIMSLTSIPASAEGLTFHYAEFDDVTLHYAKSGQGKLMLFLHGFPLFWYEWENQLNTFNDNFMTVAMDGRGYNLSSKPENVDDYKLEKLVEDVKRLAESLVGDETFILVGHDWGGGVAWAFAQQYPEKLDKLIIENVPPMNLLLQFLQTNEAQQKASRYMSVIKTPEGLERMSFDNFAALADSFRRLLEQGKYTENDINLYKKAWGQPGALTASINWYRANLPAPDDIVDTDFWPSRNARVENVPTLLIWGLEDTTFSIEFLDILPEYVDDLTIKTMPGLGHTPSLESEVLFNQIVREFIET
jgi:pimeloyl-ACP methyl ester carboxylesterase